MMRGFNGYGRGFAAAMPGMGWLGLVLMVVFWALVITALVFFIRYMVRQSRMHHGGPHGHGHGYGSEGGNAALELLKMRYAKGEIGKEEFEEKRKDLS